MDYRVLGTYIRKKRENLNVSLNEFALMIDLDPAILSRIENLKQNIIFKLYFHSFIYNFYAIFLIIELTLL